MKTDSAKEPIVIERNVHCPYCQSEDGLLLSSLSEQTSTLQYPAFGKKFLLGAIFTFGLYVIVHGLPAFEKKRTFQFHTYGFCPRCGKSYSADAPKAMVKNQIQSEKVYRSTSNKVIFGICGGIAEFTGLSPRLVRFAMVIHGFTMFPAIIYFAIGLLGLMPQKPSQY